MKLFRKWISDCRGVFRTKSNIYDEAFLQKWLTTKSYSLFSQKSCIVDLRLGSKYASAMTTWLLHKHRLNIKVSTEIPLKRPAGVEL